MALRAVNAEYKFVPISRRSVKKAMLDPVRAKAKVIGVIAASFVGGVVLASGMEWTAGSHAATMFQVGPPASEVRPLAELSESFISIAESVTPAVVSIRTERSPRAATGARQPIPDGVPEQFRRFFQNPPNQVPPQGGSGTGFIISDDGHIVTNNHVVANADVITVVTMDRRQYRAELVGRDPMTDIAVIRIDARGLPTVRLGDPNQTRVGEWVLAIGNPLGLDFTVTAGIVSAKDRSNLNILERADENVSGLTVESFIQTDAAINPGNSGGPLVNIRGEVIGVNTAIASATGLSAGYGFAVPIDLARHVADDLIRYGRWRRSVLGVQITEVELEDVEVFQLPAVAGAVIQTFSQPNTPAERAGLQAGDVIVGVDGQQVTRVNELQRMIASRRPGDRVNLEVIRYGDRRNIQVQLVETQATAGLAAATPQPRETGREPVSEGRLGIRVAPLTQELAQQLGYDSATGVIIEDFSPGGPLARRFPGPQGFKIVRIDGEAIPDVATFERIMRDKQPGTVVSLILENPAGDQRIVNVRLSG
jgi:serine protease Do